MSDIIQRDQVIVWVVCVIVLVGFSSPLVWECAHRIVYDTMFSSLLEWICAHRVVYDTMVILAYNYNLISLVPPLV